MEGRIKTRYEDNIFISNWKEFCNHKKNVVFPQGFNTYTNQQYEQYFTEKIEELFNDKQRLFYLFMDKLQENVCLIIQKLIDRKFIGRLEYEYESLYLGNKKQLLVYILHPQLVSYLEKYRLPNQFNDYKQALHLKDEQIDQLIIQRNLAISLDKPIEQIQSLTAKIQSFKDQNYFQLVRNFTNLMQEILQDFVRQQKRKQILLISTRYSTFDIINKLCREHELYFTRRFIDGAKNQKFVDMLICKTNFTAKCIEDQQQANQQQIEEHNNLQIGLPKPIHSYEIESINYCKAKCRIHIPSFGKINKIQSIIVENDKKEIEKHHLAQGTQQIIIDLKAFKKGVCKFILNSMNSAGKSASPISLKIYFDQQSQSVIKTLYILGESSKGLIPSNNKQQSEKKTIKQTTTNAFLKSFNVIDASVENCFMICDQNGNVANWGQIYVFKPKQQNQFSLPIKDFSYDCPIQQPFHMDEVKFIRKVSCGADYYLLCDRLGKAFAHGHNICAQLGIGEPDPHQNTQWPIQITRLSKYFIVDVTATKWGASFAIDELGTVFKWGAYQTAITEKPIKDSFGSVINYQLHEDIYQEFPIPIQKKYISEPAKQIHSGLQFTYCLTVDGKLYGWGVLKFLGVTEKQDSQYNKITTVCNPLLIMKGIKSISTNLEHTIVVKQDGSVWGWGNRSYLNGSEEKTEDIPIKLMQKLEDDGLIVCGNTYTVKIEKNIMKIINNHQDFNSDEYQLPGTPYKVQCKQKLIGLLVHQKNIIN